MKTNERFTDIYLERLKEMAHDRICESSAMKQRGEEWEAVKCRIEEGVITACSGAFRGRLKIAEGEIRPVSHDRVLKRVAGWKSMNPDKLLDASYRAFLGLLEEDWEREAAIAEAHDDVEESEKVRVKKRTLALVRDLYEKLSAEWKGGGDDSTCCSNT
jgi:hypothetical protein